MRTGNEIQIYMAEEKFFSPRDPKGLEEIFQQIKNLMKNTKKFIQQLNNQKEKYQLESQKYKQVRVIQQQQRKHFEFNQLKHKMHKIDCSNQKKSKSVFITITNKMSFLLKNQIPFDQILDSEYIKVYNTFKKTIIFEPQEFINIKMQILRKIAYNMVNNKEISSLQSLVQEIPCCGFIKEIFDILLKSEHPMILYRKYPKLFEHANAELLGESRFGALISALSFGIHMNSTWFYSICVYLDKYPHLANDKMLKVVFNFATDINNKKEDSTSQLKRFLTTCTQVFENVYTGIINSPTPFLEELLEEGLLAVEVYKKYPTTLEAILLLFEKNSTLTLEGNEKLLLNQIEIIICFGQQKESYELLMFQSLVNNQYFERSVDQLIESLSNVSIGTWIQNSRDLLNLTQILTNQLIYFIQKVSTNDMIDENVHITKKNSLKNQIELLRNKKDLIYKIIHKNATNNNVAAKLNKALRSLQIRVQKILKISINFLTVNQAINDFKSICNEKEKIEFLKTHSIFIDFEFRQDQFTRFLADVRDKQNVNFNMGDEYSVDSIVVARNNILHSGMDAFKDFEIRKKFKITFINEHGIEEDGSDAGGLFKEFLNLVIKDSVQTIFDISSTNEVILKSNLQNQDLCEFVGKLVGKAILDKILINARFNVVMLSQLVGLNMDFQDLKLVDPETYKNLLKIKHMSEEEFESLDLHFEQSVGTQSEELIFNGNKRKVLYQERMNQITLQSNQILNIKQRRVMREFLKGLEKAIPRTILEIFTPTELQYLISGTENADGFEYEDFLRWTTFNQDSKKKGHLETVNNFKMIVKQMDKGQRGKLLQFVTSCNRPPLKGMKDLEPRFSVKILDDKTKDYIPTASTCVNLLLINVSSFEHLQKKILEAISYNSGFQLC